MTEPPNPTKPRSFHYVKEGDIVKRMLAGTVPMDLKVTKVDENLIYCGFEDPEQAWTFDRESGVEVDEDLHWGPQYGHTGSYLVYEDE